MAYFVTVREPSGHRRTTYAAGPFNRHGDALRCVGHVRRVVHDEWPDEHWVQYGTARVKRGPLPKGRFNGLLGLPTEGRIGGLPLADNWWWTPGEPPEVDQRTERRLAARRAA